MDLPEDQAPGAVGQAPGDRGGGGRRSPRARTPRPRARPRSRTGRGSGARPASSSPGGRGSPRRSPAGCGSGRTGCRRRRSVRRTARRPAPSGATGAGARRGGAPGAGSRGGSPRPSRQMLRWVSITPLGLPVVPLVKMISNRSSGCGRGQPRTWASQSSGKATPESPAPGSAARASTVEVGKPSSRASRGSGASRPVPIASRAASARSAIRSIASGAIRRSRGTTTTPGPDRAVVDGRQLGRRRRPGQQPIAGLQAERAQPPGDDPAPPVELVEAPAHRAAVVTPETRGPADRRTGSRRRRGCRAGSTSWASRASRASLSGRPAGEGFGQGFGQGVAHGRQRSGPNGIGTDRPAAGLDSRA